MHTFWLKTKKIGLFSSIFTIFYYKSTLQIYYESNIYGKNAFFCPVLGPLCSPKALLPYIFFCLYAQPLLRGCFAAMGVPAVALKGLALFQRNVSSVIGVDHF